MKAILCFAPHNPALMLPQVQFILNECSLTVFFEECEKALLKTLENIWITHWETNSKNVVKFSRISMSLYMLCQHKWELVDKNLLLPSWEKRKLNLEINKDIILNQDMSILKGNAAYLEYRIKKLYEIAQGESQFLQWCHKRGLNRVEFHQNRFWNPENQCFIEHESAEYLAELYREKTN